LKEVEYHEGMPHINPVELANRFQSPGGDDWAAFMDRLLAAA
jgi:hypothetical protein